MPEQHFLVRVDLDDVTQLQRLVGQDDGYPAATLEELLEYLARAVADGVRRPGSWERGVVLQLTGALL